MRSSKIIVFSVVSLCFSIAVQAKKAAQTVTVTDASFQCLHKMEKVRNMYLGNLLGNLEATLAVANSPDGGTYPLGSVVQVLPSEAMVKLDKGANPATNDWEFFVLDTSAEGSKISQRGFAEVKSRLGGNCITCHGKAQSQWDMICEQDHGCEPIQLAGVDTHLLLQALQKTDPRCPSPEVPSHEELIELAKLKKLLIKLAIVHGTTPDKTASQ